MSNREFFLSTLQKEAPIFLRVIEAVPTEHTDYRPDPKSKTAWELASTISFEVTTLPPLVTSGVLDFSNGESPKTMTKDEITSSLSKGFSEIEAVVKACSDTDWDTGSAAMIFPGGKWEAQRGEMMWGMLFDLIHHRGQLSTYLRAMGGKVPSIYGPSADSTS